MAFTEPTPVYMYAVTVPKCTKYSREQKPLFDGEGKAVMVESTGKQKMQGDPCPYLDCEQETAKGEPWCRIEKHTRMMVRINDNYEQAVQRRQIKEATEAGEKLKEDDMFVADKPSFGMKLDSEFTGTKEKIPSLFEWWIPKYTTTVQFYMAVRPVQVIEVWYQWRDGAKKGQRLTAEEVAYAKKNYFDIKDHEMDQVRQEVDKPVPWRKFLFQGLMEMTVGGTKFVVTDKTMPEVPEAQQARLVEMMGQRVQQVAERDREAAAKEAAKAAKAAEKAAKVKKKESVKV